LGAFIQLQLTHQFTMFETASKFVSALEDLLRYVAPGFVGVALILVTLPAINLPPYLLSVGPGYVLVASGVLIGVILNSCHVAILEDLLCLLVLHTCRRFLPQFPENLQGKSSRQTLLRLEEHREFRRSFSEKTKQFQNRHDRFGATLTFLYCTSYSGLAIAIYQAFRLHLASLALLTGLFFLIFGIACDITYTRHDIWAATYFKEPDSTKDLRRQQA
jgi:hypothetical protein